MSVFAFIFDQYGGKVVS